MDRALNQSLSKQNIKTKFKTTWIWPLHPKVMDNPIKPNELYIIESDLDISHDEDGQSKGVVYGSQWGKDRNVAKLINITTILQNESELPKMILCNQ